MKPEDTREDDERDEEKEIEFHDPELKKHDPRIPKHQPLNRKRKRGKPTLRDSVSVQDDE